MRMFDGSEYFDEEFFCATQNTLGEIRQEGQPGLKGSVRNEDSFNYYAMACEGYKLFGGNNFTFCDVGCGMGWTVRHLQNLKENAFGIDASKWAVQSTTIKRIYRGDVRLLEAFKQEPMPDITICDRVLAYLEECEIQQALKSLWAFTKKAMILTFIAKDAYLHCPERYDHAVTGRKTVKMAHWWHAQMRAVGLWDFYDEDTSFNTMSTNRWSNFYVFLKDDALKNETIK